VKPLGQIKQKFTRKHLYDFLISSPLDKKHGRYGQFLFLFLKLNKSSPLKLENNELLLCRNDVWEILCKFQYFVPIIQLKWPPQAVLACGIFQNFSRKLFDQNNWNLVGSTYERFCIKFPPNKMAGERHKLCPLISLQFFSGIVLSILRFTAFDYPFGIFNFSRVYARIVPWSFFSKLFTLYFYFEKCLKILKE
jgi:hypothetical protein